MAIYIVTAHKKGISSLQLSRDIDVTQKTAWFMLQRIRNCFGMGDIEIEGGGGVEIDETFIGGKAKNKHAKERKELLEKGTGYVHKTPIMGMIDRDNQIVIAKQITEAKGEVLKPIIRAIVSKDSIIITDGFGGYSDLDKEFKKHVVVNHHKGHYVSGEYHTNTLEGFWSLLKRGIIGIYHYTSTKHLQKYVDEFAFRYNTRKVTESARFNLMLTNTENRLTYKNLIK